MKGKGKYLLLLSCKLVSPLLFRKQGIAENDLR